MLEPLLLRRSGQVAQEAPARCQAAIAEDPQCAHGQGSRGGQGRFRQWAREKCFPRAAAVLDRDWEPMLTFNRFPKKHWNHLRTSNPVEFPFAILRLRTNTAKRFGKADNATAVIWKMLLVAERSFRRLHAPELLEEAWKGTRFNDGIMPLPRRQAA